MSDGFDLRDYQQEAVESVFRQWDNGIRSTMVVLPTAGGKTVVASSIAERLWERHHTKEDLYSGAILFLAHREELITQTHQKFRKHIPDAKIAIEMAEHRAYGQLHRKPEIVIASTASMLSRYKKYPKNFFGAAFIDECHHSTGKSYTEPLGYFDDNLQFMLGLTATPKRHDGKAMGRLFDEVAFKMTLLQGIDKGWILEPRMQRINVSEMNLQNVSVVAGDFSKSSLSKEMSRETVIGRMVSETIERGAGRQTAIYCVDVDHMRAVEQQLKQRGQKCAMIDGKTPDSVRKSRLRDFKECAIQFIISCGTLTEGWDCPECEVIAMFRPTQSENLYEQIVGRVLRPLTPPTEPTPELRRAAIAACSKPYGIVLDFVGNSRHKLANIGDILGGTFDDEVKRLAMDLARHETGPIDMRELLKKAEQILDEQRAKRFQKGTGRDKLTRALWQLNPHPYDVLGLDKEHAESAVSRDDAYGRAPIEAAETLERYKLKPHEIQRLTNKQQVLLARVILSRSRRGLCSYAQARLLYRFGYDANLPVVAAAKVLDQVNANGDWWRPDADGINRRLVEIAEQPENRWLRPYVDEEIQRHEKLNNVLPFV
jgi:superfamily II DNA or RNA helicase